MQKRADTRIWTVMNAHDRKLDQQIREMNKVHAMFRFYGTDEHDCQSFCDFLGIRKPSDFALCVFPEDFGSMRKSLIPLRHLADDEIDWRQSWYCKELEERVTLCFNEFESCKFDFEEFSRRHIPVLKPRLFINDSRRAEDISAEEMAAIARPLPVWEPEPLEDFLERMQYERSERM